MAWNTPTTWEVGQLVTNTDMNTQVRDNLEYLYAASHDVVIAWEQQTIGTDASGTFTSGGWRTRVLNQLNDPRGLASLSSNQLTVPAGTYFCWASAPAGVGQSPYTPPLGHQIRLFNITSGITLATGTSERIGVSGGTIWPLYTRSVLAGHFVLASNSVLELQHRCEQTPTGKGFGMAGNQGPEVYAMLVLRRLGA